MKAWIVEVSAEAKANIRSQFQWLQKEAGKEAAHAWFHGIERAVESLSRMPHSRPIAPESEDFGREVHVLLYGKRRGKKFRVLFMIDDSAHTV